MFGRLRGTGPWGANVFLLVDDALTLVDTGFKGRAAHTFRQLARLNRSMAQVNSIIITHHHADHIGSLATLKAATHARVIAHPADAPFIDGRRRHPGPAHPEWLGSTLAPLHALWDTEPVTVDMLVNDGDILPVAGGVRILHTPGHTQGSISLYLEKKKMVIVGDLLSNTRGLSLPSRAFTINRKQEIDSLQRLATLDFDTICFGHGMPIRRKARQSILDFISRMHRKYNETG